MKILITGGTGFVGQRLISRLIQNSLNEITCVVRPDSKNKDLFAGKQIGVVFSDLQDVTKISKIVKDKHAVIHLAGSIFSWNKKELYHTNCDGTAALYRSLKDSNVTKFIFLSSIAAVGPQNKDIVLTENTNPHPTSLYGASKLCAENEIKTAFSEVRKDILIIRAPLIYGSGLSRESRLSLLIDRIRQRSFRYIGDGDNIISLCAVENLVEVLQKSTAITTGHISTLHIADPTTMTLRELVRLICNQLKIEDPNKSISLPFTRAIATAFDFVSKILPIHFYLTRERVEEMIGNWNMDVSKAQSLGFGKAVDSRKALINTIDWHLERVGKS